MSDRFNGKHPVFGPDRPSAAVAAIRELRDARAALTGWSDYDTPTMRARFETAYENRQHYMEYGDSMADAPFF